MTARRLGRAPVGVELVLAFAAGIVTFVIGALVLDPIESAVLVTGLGVVFAGLLALIARYLGSVYTVPVGMVGILAYDWFYLPPTHPLEVPDRGNLVELLVVLVLGVLLGWLADRNAVRAEAAERARAQVADEQAALRRVATLVASGATPERVFSGVAREVGNLFRVHGVRIARYDGNELVHVTEWIAPGRQAPTPYERAALEPASVSAEVLRTGRGARIDDYDRVDEKAVYARGAPLSSVVGAPVIVDDRTWGLVLAWSERDPLPPRTEDRLSQFAELVETAISNAESQAALQASRARLVTAADTTRRRIERDLHDGAQQRLVSTALRLRSSVRDAVPPGADELRTQLDSIAGDLDEILEGLREIARGIHPAILAEGGLRPALKTLSRRSAVPVTVDAPLDGRLPDEVELAAYYVVAEALTNAAKHAAATCVDVRAEVVDGQLLIDVRDDGRGGALASRGSGLVGLADRAEALGGRLSVHSPPGDGTTLQVSLPVGGPADGTPTTQTPPTQTPITQTQG